MKINLKDFSVPNFVIPILPPKQKQDGFVESPTWPLSGVDASELSAMCDNFRAAVFKKAGKSDPKG